MITVPTDGKTDCTADFQKAVDEASTTGDWISLGSTPYVFTAPPKGGGSPGVLLKANTIEKGLPGLIIEGLPGLTTIEMKGSGWDGQNNHPALGYYGSVGKKANITWASGGKFAETSERVVNCKNPEGLKAGEYVLVETENNPKDPQQKLSWAQHSLLYQIEGEYMNFQNPITIPVFPSQDGNGTSTMEAFNPIKGIRLYGITIDGTDASGDQVNGIAGNYGQDCEFDDIHLFNIKNAAINGWGNLRPRYRNIHTSNSGSGGDAAQYFWKETDGVYDNLTHDGGVFGLTWQQCHGLSGRNWRVYRTTGRNIKFSGCMYGSFSDIESNFAGHTGLSIQGGCGVLRFRDVTTISNGFPGETPGDRWGFALQTFKEMYARFITVENLHSIKNGGFDVAVGEGSDQTTIISMVYSTFQDSGNATFKLNFRQV